MRLSAKWLMSVAMLWRQGRAWIVFVHVKFARSVWLDVGDIGEKACNRRAKVQIFPEVFFTLVSVMEMKTLAEHPNVKRAQ